MNIIAQGEETIAPFAAIPTVPTTSDYYRQVNQQRFRSELEFLSCLSSPAYLTYLHSLGHFQSPSFLRYLAYLHQTWSQPKYVKYLRYPNAIVFCKALVDSREFRHLVGRDGWEGEMSKQIVKQWAGATSNPSSLIASAKENTDTQQHQNTIADRQIVDAAREGNIAGNNIKDEEEL
jgi:mediator of RNA polymerase II transcription subunit 31